MQNLKVPYKSQWDSDASKTFNDCGPASIAMILNYFGENLTTNAVFEKTGAGSGLIGVPQMLKTISSLGYSAERRLKQNPDDLKWLIDQDLPVIALVHYGSLESQQDKKFKGGHFFVVVGYRNDGYFVNDPNFQGKFREDGDHHFYKKSEFEKAWADCVLDGNQPNSLIVIQRKSPLNPPTQFSGTERFYAQFLESFLKHIDDVPWGDDKHKYNQLLQDPEMISRMIDEISRTYKEQKEKYSTLQRELEVYKTAHPSDAAAEDQSQEDGTNIPPPPAPAQPPSEEGGPGPLLSDASIPQLVVEIIWRLLPVERKNGDNQ